MKTEQERREADKRELEIKVENKAADQAAYQEFNKATKEEWERYEKIWQPARKRWEAFSRPHFEALQAKLVADGKAAAEALAEVRSNWKVCPECGAPAARYQSYCTNDKCKGTFLLEVADE